MAAYIPLSCSILTDAALRSRSFIFPFRCLLCSVAEEDLRYLLLKCPFVRGCEMWCPLLLGSSLLGWSVLDIWREAI